MQKKKDGKTAGQSLAAQPPKAAMKIDIWNERLRKNEAALAEEFTRMDQRANLYNGTRDIEATPAAAGKKRGKKPPDKASGVRNIVAELIEAQVDSSFPLPKVTARRQEYEGLAKTLEDYLCNETDRQPFEMMNDMDERISPVQGGSVFLVEWDSERHTHQTRGELCVSILHPRQVIFQDGVKDINDMDFVIVNMGMTKKHVYAKYHVSVENETESDPASRGGTGVSDDIVTVHFGYFRNDKGGIGRFTWVNDVVLEDLEDYQARRAKKCADCGAEWQEGAAACPSCGSRKAESRSADSFTLYEDIARSDGSIIPQYAGMGADQQIMPQMGGLPAMMPQMEPTRIPYYKPDVYPIVVRRNVSAWGKPLGDSDVDKIADQQNMIKKCDTRVQEKLDTGGSVLMKSKRTKMPYHDGQFKVIEVETPDELSCFRLVNLQVDTGQDQAVSDSNYQQARNILGITDSFQGRPDRTATSGTAKQIAVAQSAGRLESKRIMKNAMYADLYAVMFRFLLAYSDEPRAVRHKNVDGSTSYSEFNKYDYLAQDDAGEWYWIDDFLFSVDNSSSLAGNREAMWQEIRMNLQTGAFGDPADIETLILFWGMMAGQHYPYAAEIKEQLEQRRQMMEQQAQMQMPPGAAGMGQPQAETDFDMGKMDMMGGLNNAM
ncbi:MAG: hypothetical protein HFE61_09300 [Anaerotignum sp.]|nr:hypothetical protein [Anaerotignum sp.]